MLISFFIIILSPQIDFTSAGQNISSLTKIAYTLNPEPENILQSDFVNVIKDSELNVEMGKCSMINKNPETEIGVST